MEKVAEAAIKAANERTAKMPKPQSSYVYDNIVMEAIESMLPEDREERRSYLKDLEKMLTKMSDSNDWYDGARRAAGSIGCAIAWSTPGFAAARRMHDYGI